MSRRRNTNPEATVRAADQIREAERLLRSAAEELTGHAPDHAGDTSRFADQLADLRVNVEHSRPRSTVLDGLDRALADGMTDALEDKPEFLRTRDLIEILGVPRKTVMRLWHDADLPEPVIDNGHNWRLWRKADVERFLRKPKR